MPQVLYVVHAEVDPTAESAYLEYLVGTHIPEVVAAARFTRAQRFRDEADAPDGWKRWSIIYEAPRREVLTTYLEGAEVVRLRAEVQDKFGAQLRLSRQVLVEAGAPFAR